MTKFFQIFEPSNRQVLPLLPRCGECGLFKKCHSPKMPLVGEGRKKIMVVGEAPGKTEDEKGIPFVGAAGRLLQEELGKVGISLFRDCWVINSASCHPPKNEYPPKTVDHCRPLVVQHLKEKQPRLTLLLGAKAVQSVIGWMWKEDVGGIFRWAGFHIPSNRVQGWVCPLYHPSYLLREEKGFETAKIIWRRHLKSALSLLKKEWSPVPDYSSRVRVEMDHVRAGDSIKEMIGRSPVAVDYETNMKKPDSGRARIVSCAVSNGKRTISYPWVGEAIKATQELLRSGTPIVGANNKFEERWSRKEFGRGVKNWAFDTMLAAHVLDNRRGICGLKFQAFALLGQEDWDAHIKPYLKSHNDLGNEPNRITELSLPKLLHYGGLDALLEWEVARIQCRKLGLGLFKGCEK